MHNSIILSYAYTVGCSYSKFLILDKIVKSGITPHGSVSNKVYKRLVHEPNQAECCNHALIPLCNIPTTKIFKILGLISRT
jgi:hypothetical protein